MTLSCNGISSLLQYSSPIRPIAMTVYSSLLVCLSSSVCDKRRKILLLYAPARPLSAVTMIYPVFFTSRFCNMGWVASVLFVAIFVTTSLILSLYETYFFAFSSAFENLEAETISFALVICCVFVVELIRSWISLRDAKLFTTLLKQRYVRCFEIQSIYAFCLLFSWQESLFKVLNWFFHFFFVLRLTCFANFV